MEENLRGADSAPPPPGPDRVKTVESKLNWINFDPKTVFATESRYRDFSRIERLCPLLHTNIYSSRTFLCYQCLLRYRITKEKRS